MLKNITTINDGSKSKALKDNVELENDDVDLENNIKTLQKLDINKEDNENLIIGLNNNNVWKHIFEQIKYDGSSDTIISATQIKECKKSWKGDECQFEPRLLCKQDCDEDRPQIFKNYNLCIISVKNGDYLLTKNYIYFRLPYNETKIIEIKKNNDSLLLNIGNSETSLIDNLRYSGLFERNQYLNEPILYGSLLNGRHRCKFNTTIGNKSVKIIGSQYETDSCYESKNKILLIEGKSINNIKSFNIRQLYFPYRTIYDKVKDKKEILCLFINKDKNNIIHIWKFQFENPLIMTGIKNIGYDTYKFST